MVLLVSFIKFLKKKNNCNVYKKIFVYVLYNNMSVFEKLICISKIVKFGMF